MLILVLANNLLFTFVGWEGVGLCSYWLVSFWFERDTAASAGQKAFLYNRLADVGFLIAIFLVFDKTGTLNYLGHLRPRRHIGSGARTAICLLLFVAAVGKSAQIPLFPWLADAMEGPTPVSALIHAATMVTAGVYLMCRISPLLALAHDAQIVVATVGAVTAFVAATIACAQQDIKKVLAYSTVSQLGLHVPGRGDRAPTRRPSSSWWPTPSSRRLLFLGAGSVIHGLHDEQDLKKMGNLRRYMKLTFVTFGIGWLAIAGIPPLSGFFAKGDILDNAFARYPALWVVGLVTAALTAYYMTRLFVLAFYGEDRWTRRPAPRRGGHGAGGAEPHESPWVMALPLVVLAVLALVGGLLNLPGHLSFDPLGWLAPVFGTALYQAHQSRGDPVGPGRGRRRGGGGAGWAWRRGVVAAGSTTRPSSRWSCRSRTYIDDIYDAVIGRPGEALRPVRRRLRHQGHRRGRERGGPAGPGRRRAGCGGSRPASSASTRWGS